MVRGTIALLHATAITDRWGTIHFGRLSGLLVAPSPSRLHWLPSGAALTGELGGYPAFFGLFAGVSVVAGVLAAASVSR
ncbi:hypothetical protein [Streptomyces sp. NBC_00582]|uniref:hypothetical protein n=1 Tax=Streptomyces sp. NBC_00582 TaxID=2975783 RepID=UPI002E7FDDA0|nr:hypothetical protein [Streptomyces sp. NBC_00582]WUB60923.1 hypothetical protein OG852_11260 [Streptomyces sp. NBC_00582]